jgi:hypothetical protein
MERFMESPLFETDLLTAHEPWIPGGETPAATEARFLEPHRRIPARNFASDSARLDSSLSGSA